GLVYLSESHFRGWQAALNGEPTDILRANYAFRAVEVPAGDVQLELSYLPPGLRAGATVSGLSLAAVVALLLAGLARRQRAAPSQDAQATGE
ncbi:MAG: YfhO family protein, partial [Acidobacteriota bacterium]